MSTPQLTRGDRLRRARLESGLGTDELAELLYMHRNTVSHWENDRSEPTTRKLQQWATVIAEHTSYEVDDLLAFIEDRPVSITERRRQERRTRPRQPRRQVMWISAA